MNEEWAIDFFRKQLNVELRKTKIFTLIITSNKSNEGDAEVMLAAAELAVC